MNSGRFRPSSNSSLFKRQDEGRVRPAKPEKPASPPDAILWRLAEWFPDLRATVIARLHSFQAELLKFNAKLNLVSRNTERESDEVHFADCICAAQLIGKEKVGQKVYDIGSGNGFPGLVMAILDEQVEYLMVESDARKAEFLKHAISTLGVKNAVVLNVRFENLGDVKIQTAVSRGFASIAKTVLTCNRLFAVSGRVYHLKGNSWSTELAEMPSQVLSVWAPKSGRRVHPALESGAPSYCEN